MNRGLDLGWIPAAITRVQQWSLSHVNATVPPAPQSYILRQPIFSLAWYWVAAAVAIPIVIALLIPYIRKRYVDSAVVCPICGASYDRRREGSCPKCGAGSR